MEDFTQDLVFATTHLKAKEDEASRETRAAQAADLAKVRENPKKTRQITDYFKIIPDSGRAGGGEPHLRLRGVRGPERGPVGAGVRGRGVAGEAAAGLRLQGVAGRREGGAAVDDLEAAIGAGEGGDGEEEVH